jgi:hypothetical protein
MPEDHRKYTQWNSERFISWARGVGDNTVTVVKAILASRKIEQQGYRACMALLKLADKYSPSRLEAACKRALTYTPSPSFKSVQTILATGQDILPDEKPVRDISIDYGFTRGPEYYGEVRQTKPSSQDSGCCGGGGQDAQVSGYSDEQDQGGEL